MTRDSSPDALGQDSIGEKLLASGLVRSWYALDRHTAMEAPASFLIDEPWTMPSRLFRFPIETSAPTATSPRRIGLLHPRLADHPFVRHVEAVMGFALEPDGAPNYAGYTQTKVGPWWHACDLISNHWQDLLATRQFTSDDMIARAVAFGLQYRRGFSLAHAHKVMQAIGATAPDDRPRLMRRLRSPSHIKPEKGTGPGHWAVNFGAGDETHSEAWTMIVGLEDGWLHHDRSGFVAWTEAGREAHAKPDGPPPYRKPLQLGLF